MVAFVTVLICSEFISAGKVARIGSLPISARASCSSRSAICSATSSRGLRLCPLAESDLGGVLGPGFRNNHDLGHPGPSPRAQWPHQTAWETVFSNSWRIVAASLTAFLVG